MTSNVIPFPILEIDDNWPWFMYSRLKSIRRRMDWLIKVENQDKVVRERTIRRCYSVINRKWSQLSSFIHNLRGDSEELKVIVSLCTELLLRTNNNIDDNDALVKKILEIAPSNMEMEVIIELLWIMGINRKNVLKVASGKIRDNIKTISDFPWLWLTIKRTQRGEII